MKIIILAFIFGLINAEFFIYEKLDRKLLENAREVGEKAKIAYMKGPDSVADAKLRYNLYLDGLEQCDSLGSEQLFKVIKHINETANATAAAEFEKIGLKPFQSQFMTLKVDVMKEVIDM
uniref:Uncharacterized protein n=1 Tax=Acrobeloides nanus TaxID=290746 RepID=A0A914DGF9_9BILA